MEDENFAKDFEIVKGSSSVSLNFNYEQNINLTSIFYYFLIFRLTGNQSLLIVQLLTRSPSVPLKLEPKTSPQQFLRTKTAPKVQKQITDDILSQLF